MNLMTLVVFVVMMALIVGLVVAKKVNIYAAYALLPMIAALVLGYSVSEMVELFESRILETMVSSALLVLFSVAFFSTLSEAGMFAVVVHKIVQVSKGNPMIIYLATLAVGLVTSMDGSLIACYAITIPALMPLYNALGLDRKKLLFLTAISVAITLPLPWNAVATSIASANTLDGFQLFYSCVPSMALVLLAAAALCVLWGRRDRDKARAVDESVMADPRKASDKPLYRVKLFWVNLILCVAAIAAVICYRAIPAWSVFMIFFFTALCVNYRDDRSCMGVFNRAAPVVILFLMILLPIQIMIGVMVETGMIRMFVGVLMKFLPGVVLKYFFLMMAFLLVLILKYLPYQIILGFLPVFTLLAGQYGIAPLFVCIPFTANLCLGSLSSAMVAQTQLGSMLSQVDIKEFQKFAIPKQWVINVGVLAVGIVFGFYGL